MCIKVKRKLTRALNIFSIFIMLFLTVLPAMPASIVDANSQEILTKGDTPKPWPTVFTPYTTGDGKSILDPGADVNPIDVDITSGVDRGVGNLPSMYVASDGSNFFVRLRLKGDPYDRKGGFLSSVWLVKLAVGGEHKATIGVNGKSPHYDYVYVADSSGGNVQPIYVTPTQGGNSVPGTEITPDGNGHYFLDFQVPIERINEIAPEITKTTPVQVFFGTSKAANLSVINKEWMDTGSSGGSTTSFSGLQAIELGDPDKDLVPQLTSSPPTISINGPAKEKFESNNITVSGKVSVNKNVTIEINDQTRTITPTGTNGDYSWTTNLSSGTAMVPDRNGIYTLVAYVEDEVGDKSVKVKASKEIEIEKTNNANTITIEDGNIREVTDNDFDGNGKLRINGTFTVSNNGNYIQTTVHNEQAADANKDTNTTWSYLIDKSKLQAGNNSITVKIHQQGQGTVLATVTQQLIYLKDGVEIITPLSVSIDSIHATGSARPEITGKSSGAESVEIQISRDGGPYRTIEIRDTRNNNNWSVEPLETPLRVGTYTVRAIAKNAAGTEFAYAYKSHTVSEKSITIDNGSGVPDRVVINDRTPIIRGTTNLDDGLDKVRVKIGGIEETVDVVNNRWFLEVNNELTGSDYTINAELVEDNNIKATQELRIIASTFVNITAPVPDEYGFIAETEPTIGGTVQAGSLVNLKMLRGDEFVFIEEVVPTGTTWEYDVSSPLLEGDYQVIAIAYDDYGNEAEATSIFSIAGGSVSIEDVADVTKTVAYGTSIEDAKAALGTEVTVVLEDGEEVTVPITWSDNSTPEYQGNNVGEYEFSGTFGTLPNGVNNDKDIGAPKGIIAVQAGLSNEKEITAYSFEEQTKVATIDSEVGTITVEVAHETEVEDLIATFTLSDKASAKVGEAVQTSEVTPNDFTNEVTYVVKAEDGTTKNWTVQVTVQEQTAKPVIPEPVRAGMETIRGTSTEPGAVITITRGTEVIGTGTVNVDGTWTVQVTEGMTLSATDALSVRAKAEGKAESEVAPVVVQNALSDKKEITLYSFKEQTGAATIHSGTGTIAIEVAHGTEVDQLVATFTLSDKASAKVGEEVQTSEVTPNDFTNEVIYILTAEDGTRKEWTVQVTVQEQTATPVVTEPVRAGMKTISGTSTETGAVITITRGADVIGTGTVNGDGTWTVQVSEGKVLSATDALSVTAKATGKAESEIAPVVVQNALSNEKEITSYSFEEQTGAATIHSGTGMIAIEVAHGTEVDQLIATFTLSDKASAKVGEAVQTSEVTPNDFTNQVTYVVTAEDGTTKNWTVQVTVQEQTATPVIPEPVRAGMETVSGTSQEVGAVIAITRGPDVIGTGIVKEDGTWTVEVTEGKTLSATDALSVTAKAEGKAESEVTPVVVQNELSGEKEITTYSFEKETGAATINSGTGTIAIEVAHGTEVGQLVATFTLSDKASAKVGEAVQTSEATPNDFTNEVTYVVTAEDGTTKNWTVQVTVQEQTATPVIPDPVRAGMETIRGTSTEPGAVITITRGEDVIGTGTVNEDGIWTVQVPEGKTLSATDALIVRAKATGKAESEVTPVVVQNELSNEKEITSYSFEEQTGAATIHSETGTIAIEVAHGTEVDQLVATFTLSDKASAKVGESVQTSEATPNDFTNEVTYVVTAEDGTTKNWTVKVTVQEQTVKPVVTEPVRAGMETVSGTSPEVGAVITITRGEDVIGTGTVKEDGTWTVEVTEGKTLSATDALSVRAKATGKAESEENLVMILPVLQQEVDLSLTSNPTSIVGDGYSQATLKAVLKDSEGNPIPNIEVEFAATAGSLSSPIATTNSDGEATVTLTSSKIEGTEPVIEVVKATVDSPQNGIFAEEEINIHFAPPIIQGQVLDADGEPISNATVWVEIDGIKYEATTDEDGNYSIIVPRGGNYTLNIEVTMMFGGREVTTTFTQQVSVQATGQEEKFKPERKVSGQLFVGTNNKIVKTMNEVLPENSNLVVQVLNDPDNRVTATIDNDGKYELLGFEAGKTYEVVFNVEIDGNRMAGEYTEIKVGEDGQIVVQFELIDPYGLITDSVTGELISGVNMKLYWADTDLNKEKGRIPGELVPLPVLPDFPPNQNENPQISTDWLENEDTAEIGNYAWMVFAQGDYYLVGEKDGYVKYDSRTDLTTDVQIGDSWIRDGVIHIGETIMRYDFSMVKKVATTIEVSGASEIEVPATGSTSESYTAVVKNQYGAQMQEDVTWSLKSVVTGVSIDEMTGELTVEAITDADKAIVVASSGGLNQEYDIVLKKIPPPVKAAGSVSGEGKLTVSEGTPEAIVTLYDKDGIEIITGTIIADGTYEFTDVPPGKAYTVVQTVNGVSSSHSNAVDVAPNKPVTLEGKVNDADGTVEISNLVPGATVILKDKDGNVVASGTANEDGTFTFSDMEKGVDYTVTQEVNGVESEPLPFRLLTDEEEVDDTLRNLNVGYKKESDTWESVTDDVYLIRLDSHETEVKWSASRNNEVVIITDSDCVARSENEGCELVADVARKETDRSVIVTATVTKGEVSKQRTFLLIVKASTIDKQVDNDNGRTITTPGTGSNSISIPVTRINVTDRSVNSTAKIDKVILSDDVATSISQAAAANGKTAVVPVPQDPDNKADEFAIEIPRTAVSAISQGVDALKVKTDFAHLTLEKAQLATMKENNLDLFFRLLPLKEENHKQQVRNTIQNDTNLKANVGNKQVETLGSPLKIETNYANYDTNLIMTFSSNGITLPMVNQDEFLQSLAIYIEHSDGDKVLKRVSDNGATIVYEDNQPIGLSINISKFSTFTVVELKDPPPSGGAPAPTTETITIDVETGGETGATIVSTATIIRTTAPNGTKKDEVIFTPEKAIETVEKVKGAEQTTARIIIPDLKDEVSEIMVRIPLKSAQELSSSGINLEIVTENGKVIIPATSLAGLTGDLYFRLIPIKDDVLQQEVRNRAINEDVVKKVSDVLKPYVVARPMTIETNMPSRPVTLVLPLKDVEIPEKEEERYKFLNSLAVFIEHSDGDRVLTRGKVVTYDKQQLGQQIDIEKFSTFTILNWEGEDLSKFLGELLIELDREDAHGFHEKYINGFPDGTFKPEESVTRAQMAAMLARNLGYDESMPKATTSYPDVRETHWAKGVIEFMKEVGLMEGDPTGNFRPDASISRAEMTAIASRYRKLEIIVPTEFAFSDAQNHWATNYIEATQSSGIISGYVDGTFRPNKNLTRAEAAKVVNRMFERGPLYGVTTPSWPDVLKEHWAFEEIEEASQDHYYTKRKDGDGENLFK
ncbi:S-layer homology domain-containing protein [Bacillus sp. FJAT-45350]|uniref:S-layer homology domain-containing protein n=1 Tax=Bacillus sp. FJAT-45350 TaxID=2011014 RepID=UPI000BB915A6|nr:S-layer homology domain-containing protein [Bacillus sp. FJAT-45350]